MCYARLCTGTCSCRPAPAVGPGPPRGRSRPGPSSARAGIEPCRPARTSWSWTSYPCQQRKSCGKHWQAASLWIKIMNKWDEIVYPWRTFEARLNMKWFFLLNSKAFSGLKNEVCVNDRKNISGFFDMLERNFLIRVVLVNFKITFKERLLLYKVWNRQKLWIQISPKLYIIIIIMHGHKQRYLGSTISTEY